MRAGVNAIANAGEKIGAEGVCTCSAGNFGQGLAYCAKQLGVPCTIVVPDHAPETKLKGMERLGAKVIKVPFGEWWQIIETHQCPQAKGQHFIHPGGEQAVLAGNGTIGLEIVEDVPDVDVVIVPYGSGSMATAVASVVKELRPRAKVFAVEPETAAPFAASMKAGRPVPAAYEATFVDGCGGKSVLGPIWELGKDVLDGGLTVSIAATAAAIKLVAERNRVVCEGAGACPVAAAMAMAGVAGAPRKIVCVVSGGGLDTAMLCRILSGNFPASTGALSQTATIVKLARL